MRRNLKELYRMLNQDIGFEDTTTRALIPSELIIKARIISKQRGVVAGLDLIYNFLGEFEIAVLDTKKDGDSLKAGQTILEMEGDASTILTLERTVLNILMRMSAIATITSHMVEKARRVNSGVIIAGTRKTTPGLQFWEKEAIRIGGGDTHRYRLDDAVLIKDNHLALVGEVALAVEKAREYASFTKKIEIEVETKKDTIIAAESGADIIMLDNMSVNEVESVIKDLNDKGLRNNVIIEVSGGINPDNLVEYAKTGVDVISTGFITHSAGVLDLSLEIIS
ncbi:MAG TPA: carboxylating nicotinate-nucleotide diphosphorylase [Methanobacterium sp.]|nr:carboxylating nicotinate-nucleotide diphosphorylase [Methanobacterium sp.]